MARIKHNDKGNREKKRILVTRKIQNNDIDNKKKKYRQQRLKNNSTGKESLSRASKQQRKSLDSACPVSAYLIMLSEEGVLIHQGQRPAHDRCPVFSKEETPVARRG